MITLVVATLVLAAPRTEGFYVDEAGLTLLNAPAVSEDELIFVEPMHFTKEHLLVQYVLETVTSQWRRKNGVVEVQSSDGVWTERVWRELPGDVVETDVIHAGTVERLHFVKGSFDERKRLAGRAFTAAQLERLTGRYGEGPDAITIDPKSKLTATSCFDECTTFASVCLASQNLFLFETDTGVVRLPGVEGLCGSYRAGVKPETGVVLPRMTAVAKAPVGKVDAKRLVAVLEARSGRLSACNKTTAPLHVKLAVTIGRSGFLSALDAGQVELSECLGEALARLVFPTQSASTTVTAEWDVPVRP